MFPVKASLVWLLFQKHTVQITDIPPHSKKLDCSSTFQATEITVAEKRQYPRTTISLLNLTVERIKDVAILNQFNSLLTLIAKLSESCHSPSKSFYLFEKISIFEQPDLQYAKC